MTKIKLTIYLISFIIILSSLFVSIFALVKKNNPQNVSISPTPSPIPITNINWSEAVSIIQDCQIKTVFQKHNLEVTLTHKDNRVFKTIEPKIDDIFNETNHLPSNCNDIIQTITE